ncbi:hypothetical protein [Arsenicicoccus dermatophilus]|uniref:hypothetical protein n=1 Tax=Arsenicicoccus dermatophilus TaxID=1076331 RepID=UPI001F4CFF52|nr:hypothetical protein [Arsenicicoccus dermatophilus]
MTAVAAGATRASRSLVSRASGVRLILVSLLAYLATRVISGILIARAATQQVPVSWTGDPVTYWGMTLMWDGTWYRKIAETGYPATLPLDPSGQVAQNEWAFYPAYPLLCRAVMTVTGLPFRYVGAGVATVLGCAAAVLLVHLLRRRCGDAVAVLAMLVWATYLATPVLQIAYTESLAMLLLVGFLMLLERERWWWATVLALVIGLSRPIGLPLGLVALVAVWLRWRRHGERPIPPREWAGMAATLAGCGIAGFVWPAVAWAGTGSRTAYTDTMGAWRTGHEIHPFVPWWDNAQYFFHDRAALVLGAYVLGLVLLVAGPWAASLGWVMRSWLIAYPLYLFAVQDPHTSLYRYLVLMFPAALIGVGAARRLTVPTVLRAGVLIGAGVALQVWWTQAILVLHLPASWPP